MSASTVGLLGRGLASWSRKNQWLLVGRCVICSCAVLTKPPQGLTEETSSDLVLFSVMIVLPVCMSGHHMRAVSVEVTRECQLLELELHVFVSC